MNKGIIAINKPKDWTSFDVVNKVRHLLGIKRVGHLGTLDPMATGVLLITFGSATKLFDIMQEKVKTYIAEFELGRLTDTLDATGKTIMADSIEPINEQILECSLQKFIGEIDQIPPKYSAKSVNGVRAYDLARQDVDFELPAKRVKIFDIKLIDYNIRFNKFMIEVKCGSGTYIRSLGRDIANEIGTVATMTNLVRTNVGKFNIDNSVSIQNLTRDNIDKYCLDLDTALDYETLNLDEAQVKKILNGQTLILNENDGIYKLNQENDIVALVKICEKHAKMIIFLG